jgi:hypothetical protein
MKAPVIVLLIAILCVIVAGCIAGGKDPVVGTWEWSDGKGYTELYTFGVDHSFRAEALGSEFAGTWEATSTGHYQVRYRNAHESSGPDLTESVLYDGTSDAIYFPAHRRVA